MARIGVVLSGGAARGAYEAGALAGIIDVLGVGAGGPSTFNIISGTSVGAINGAWLAANSHRADHDLPGLVSLWEKLSLSQRVRLDLRSLIGRSGDSEHFGRSLFNPRPLEELVISSIDWERLHANIEHGRLQALIVAALHIGTGVTTLFTELAEGVRFNSTNHPRRISRPTRIGPEHVLASSAIPMLFPARRIGGAFFADGGLRFNTPISPALRAGAQRLVIITLRHEETEQPRIDDAGAAEELYPNPIFLLGKMLNALLLDPVAEDLETLQHLNAFVEATQHALDLEQQANVDTQMRARRGRTYRKIETLHLRPSRNIGVMAGEHLREHRGEGGALSRFLWSRAAHEQATWEADLASYVLFDATWTSRLTALGRADAFAQRDRILQFFAT